MNLCAAMYIGAQVLLASRSGCHYLLELDLEAVVISDMAAENCSRNPVHTPNH